jgi:4-amino-4-deoxy-L-arabinose transferase-like glycosyltransferase
MALALFTAFFEIGRRDVVDANEGQRAAPPAEMLRRGDFVIPTINEDDYLKKPPLIYWMIAGVYAATGVISPVTARIPTAISFVVLIVCVYLYARRTLGESAARWGALALMTAPYLVDRGRYAELDTPLTLATFLAIIAFWKACDTTNMRSRASFVLLSGIALGAGVLLKGPVPFLFLAPAWIA